MERRVGERSGAALIKQNSFEPPTTGNDATLATALTTIVTYDETTQHNIPQIFWMYMQQQPADWLYAFGHPITEPYWACTKIGGVEQWVLVQLFERRSLTCTPNNPPAWQVEMGNVGQHYYEWRYTWYSSA